MVFLGLLDYHKTEICILSRKLVSIKMSFCRETSKQTIQIHQSCLCRVICLILTLSLTHMYTSMIGINIVVFCIMAFPLYFLHSVNNLLLWDSSTTSLEYRYSINLLYTIMRFFNQRMQRIHNDWLIVLFKFQFLL